MVLQQVLEEACPAGHPQVLKVHRIRVSPMEVMEASVAQQPSAMSSWCSGSVLPFPEALALEESICQVWNVPKDLPWNAKGRCQFVVVFVVD